MISKAILAWGNEKYHSYKSNNSDIAILSFFLCSEIRCSNDSIALSLIESWMLNSQEMHQDLNLTHLEKEHELILLTTEVFGSYDDIIEIDRKNFVEILDQWKKLCIKKPKEIIINRDASGHITLKGNNNIIFDALLRFDGTKYWYGGSNNQELKTLAYFLIQRFESEGLSRRFIFDLWLDDQQEKTIQDKPLLIEKKDDTVSISYQYQDGEKESAFVTTKEQLRRIYKQFEGIKMLEPNVIRIYKDGDEIKLEGLADEI